MLVLFLIWLACWLVPLGISCIHYRLSSHKKQDICPWQVVSIVVSIQFLYFSASLMTESLSTASLAIYLAFGFAAFPVLHYFFSRKILTGNGSQEDLLESRKNLYHTHRR